MNRFRLRGCWWTAKSCGETTNNIESESGEIVRTVIDRTESARPVVTGAQWARAAVSSSIATVAAGVEQPCRWLQSSWTTWKGDGAAEAQQRED